MENLETMTDSKYFTTTKKGEIFELRADLASDRRDKKKNAVKKVMKKNHININVNFKKIKTNPTTVWALVLVE